MTAETEKHALHPVHHHHHLPLLPSSSPSASPEVALSHVSHPFRTRSIDSAHSSDASLHPTEAVIHSSHPSTSSPSSAAGGSSTTRLSWRWTSRAHRKGVPPQPVVETEEAGGRTVEVRKEGRTAGGWENPVKFVRETRWWGWDLGDISWWVAFIFTIGSVFWCVNGIMFFCYFSNTSTTFYNTESAFGFLGGTTFWIGAYLGWVETLNPASLADKFGWEIREEGRLLVQPSRAHPSSALGLRRRHFGSYSPPTSSSSSSSDPSSCPVSAQWRWFAFPSSKQPASSPVSWKNMGYLANTIQFFGATCFQISVICGLPGALPEAGSVGGPEQQGSIERTWIAAYWAMQVLGAPCFIIAGTIFAIEVQKKWYIPNLKSIGWHIGFWNVIGGYGFLFSGIFGIWRQTSITDPSQFQYWGTAFSTFWGSWAFLIGSYVQLLETLNKWT